MLSVKNLILRRLMFLGLCIPLRTLAVYLSKQNKYTTLIGLAYLIAGFGIGYLYFTNSRLTGGEVFNKKIWWHHHRIIFSIIWLTFAVLALTRNHKIAWKVLSLDVIYGLIIFTHRHLTL
tara:strand:- start:1 stop:360 length:360 start_codon:yes stop_codon:yes gene_type:complete